MIGRAAWLVTIALAGCQCRGTEAVRAQARANESGCILVREGYGPKGKVPVQVAPVVSGLEVPWAIAFLPNGGFLVTERPGRVRLFRDGRLEPAPVIEFPKVPASEGGLMGLALHPGFTQNRLVYLYRTAEGPNGTANQVERWKLAGDARSAVFDRLILGGIAAAKFHDGGRLRFGPDGMLYLGTGDASQPGRSQDRTSLNGKLLRLTPDGAIPSDNPFPGSPVLLWGIRNTEGFDFKGKTIYLVDHGPSGELGRTGHDEVNVAHPGDNLGWPTIFGCQQAAGLLTPSLSWVEAVPPGGAALYDGSEIPEWRGSLLVGTLKSRHLHRVVFDAKDERRVISHEVYFEGDPPAGLGRLRETLTGPDGALWLTTSNCDGRGTCPEGKDRIIRVVKARP